MNALIPFLLDAETPTIRYLTLRKLLGRSEEDPKVRTARNSIMTAGLAPTIFAQQDTNGYWQAERSYYTPKYVSTHWTMMMLAELQADGGDLRVQRGVEFMLEKTASRIADDLASGRYDMACLWGNVYRYAAQFGYTNHSQAETILAFLIRSLVNGPCRCFINSGFACAWGTVRTLWGIAALPAATRTSEVQSAIEQSLAFLLKSHALARADYPVPENGKIHPLWFKLNFPLFYQVDILFTLRVLGELEMLDHPGARPALQWLADQQGKNGLWSGRSPYRTRSWDAFVDHKETNRWISLQAAIILQEAGWLNFRETH